MFFAMRDMRRGCLDFGSSVPVDTVQYRTRWHHSYMYGADAESADEPGGAPARRPRARRRPRLPTLMPSSAASLCLLSLALPAAFGGAYAALIFASRLFTARETEIYGAVTHDGAPTMVRPAAGPLLLERVARSHAVAVAASAAPPPPNTSPPPPVVAAAKVVEPAQPPLLNASTAPRRRRRTMARPPAPALPAMVDICFLALGASTQIDFSTSIIRNIEAQSARRYSVRYHLLVDQSPTMLRTQMHTREKWRGVPKRRVFLHSVKDIPREAQQLYRALSRTATGPGPIYLYKPLLHLVLPTWLSHVIVLDTDLFVFSDVRELWQEFARFGPRELLGLAVEQCPSYLEVRALGGMGLNGGVQLLALSRMRSSAAYAKLVGPAASARAEPPQ